MRSLVAAPVVLLALTLAGCGGGDDEKSEDATTSPSAAAAELPRQCVLLDEEDRAALAGMPLEHHGEYRGAGDHYSYSEGSCSWRDSELMDYTAELSMTGMRANAWARDIDAVLPGSLSTEELQDLVDTEEQRAALSDGQACELWAAVTAAYMEEPDGDIASESYKRDESYGVDGRYVARAEICQDGVFAELSLVTKDEISKDRLALLEKQIETVWERARDRESA